MTRWQGCLVLPPAGTVEEKVKAFVERQVEQEGEDPEEAPESTAMEANQGAHGPKRPPPCAAARSCQNAVPSVPGGFSA